MVKCGYYRWTMMFVNPLLIKKKILIPGNLDALFWNSASQKYLLLTQFFLLFSIPLHEQRFFSSLDSYVLLRPTAFHRNLRWGYWHHPGIYNLRSSLGHRTWQTTDPSNWCSIDSPHWLSYSPPHTISIHLKTRFFPSEWDHNHWHSSQSSFHQIITYIKKDLVPNQASS